MKILTIIGARPQIIKSAAISLPIREKFAGQITEVVVHTGQHYDLEMSDNFFGELDLPKPKYNLAIGSGSQAVQTAAMLVEIERLIQDENPDLVLIYGDTNSTVAAALAASKQAVNVAHIEAGMRSFNKSMPEEINRVLSDHVSSFLFCPTDVAMANLQREGFSLSGEGRIDSPLLVKTGDIMYDNAIRFAGKNKNFLQEQNLKGNDFILATFHRASNTKSKDQVVEILHGIERSAIELGIKALLPLHPRTRAILDGKTNEALQSMFNHIRFLQPLGYLETLTALQNARLIITDSGGLQKEAAFFNKPAVVLRTETEWTELIDCGLARLSGIQSTEISLNVSIQAKTNAILPAGMYGDGRSGEFILTTLLYQFRSL